MFDLAEYACFNVSLPGLSAIHGSLGGEMMVEGHGLDCRARGHHERH